MIASLRKACQLSVKAKVLLQNALMVQIMKQWTEEFSNNTMIDRNVGNDNENKQTKASRKHPEHEQGNKQEGRQK